MTYTERLEYEERILAAEMEIERVKRLVASPCETGAYIGDTFYPVGGAEASHRWDGYKWRWITNYRDAGMSDQLARTDDDSIGDLKPRLFEILRRHNVGEQCFAEVAALTFARAGTVSDVAPVGGYHVTAAQYEAAVKGRRDFRQAYREQLELLSQKEWAAVAQIGVDQELSTSAVLRQAVRLYQMHLYRLKAGETLSWSGDEQRAKDFAGPLYAHPPHPAPVDPVAGGEALREAVAKIIATGVFGDPWWWKEAFDDGSDGIAVRNRADDVSVADAVLAALKGPAA